MTAKGICVREEGEALGPTERREGGPDAQPGESSAAWKGNGCLLA